MRKVIIISILLVLGLNGLCQEKDSIQKIIPDFFKVNQEQFEKFKSGNYSNWFISKDKTSRLYFIPYTDYSITTAVITSESELPDNIVQLLKSESIDFLNNDQAIPIDEIVSQRNIKLEMSKQSVIGIYGSPDSISNKNNKEYLNWTYQMLPNEKEKFGGLKPFILEGLFFVVEMTFQNDKLVTLIYRYEIP